MIFLLNCFTSTQTIFWRSIGKHNELAKVFETFERRREMNWLMNSNTWQFTIVLKTLLMKSFFSQKSQN
jgi:hypothetical protein